MTDQLLDARLHVLFEGLPDSAPLGTVDRALDQARGISQRRPRFPRFDLQAWPPRRRSLADPAVQRSARLALLVALVLTLLVAIVGAGSRLLTNRRELPASLTPAGALRPVVRGPTLTALADGRLLVVGQGGAGDYALVFDPRTGTSSREVGPVEPPFVQAPQVSALPDGRVLLIGQLDDGSGSGPSAIGWLDVASGKVSVAAQMITSRFAPGFAVLPDGRILVSGGLDLRSASSPAPVNLASVEVFDPRTSAFALLPPLPEPRIRHSMLPLDDGRVLIVGGAGPTGSGLMSDVLDVDIYDPANGQSTVVGTIGEGRGLTAGPPLRLADGSVLIPGGAIRPAGCGNVDAQQAMYRFDPGSLRVTALAPLPHFVGQAVALPDGRVLVFGSHGAVPWCPSDPPAPTYPWLGVYDPRSGVTVVTTDPTSGPGGLQVQVTRTYVSGALLPDGRVALIADDSGRPVPNPVDLFRPGN